MRLLRNKKTYPSIPGTVLAYIAWRNLATKKLRTVLTLLGVVIGIGSIYFLLSLGIGLQNLVTEEIIGNQSVKSIDITSPNSRVIKLDSRNAEKIEGLAHVESVGRSYTFAGSMQHKGSEVDTVVYGVDKNYIELSNLTLAHGKLLEGGDPNQIVLNKAALEVVGLQNSPDTIGQTVQLKIPLQQSSGADEELDLELAVAGIIDSGAGSEVFIHESILTQAEVSQYSQVKILADDTESIPGLRTRIHSLGFETTSPIDTIDQINQIFKYFNFVLAGFGAIGMIVAILGMFNTLTISLLERTREIGLMIALGGRNIDMRRIFVLEAVMLSVIGSVVGIVIASLQGSIVNIWMNRMASGRGVTESFDLFASPWWLIVGLIMFMVLVGLMVVFFPSRRAARINPIDALRRE